ncbi:hypothetical protein EKN54_03415 [Enterobacter hormaechei]|nr:hypothetical protein EKN54_03415 [Enterobacter hormaechei]
MCRDIFSANHSLRSTAKLRAARNDPPLLSPIPTGITFFTPGYSLTITRCYHSPRKYLSTQSEALMLENVIIR